MLDHVTTIVAPATAPGRAGVSVIRLSGPLSLSIIKTITKKEIKPRLACCRNIYDNDDSIIDNVLALFFKGPNSYTGEDVIEIHCHGSPVIVDMILTIILNNGAEFAGPGEFTKRAFLNGKLDLYQAESVASLIAADSEKAVKSASRSLCGHFSSKISTFQAEMTDLRVYIEACLDFTDEDIEFLSKPQIEKRLGNLLRSIEKIEKSLQVGKIVTDGAKVVLLGPTNAGKSSLFNQLSGEDDAIVTSESGTTRDALKQQVKVGKVGLNIDLVDTAGIRETTGIVEQEGIIRSKKHAAASDIIILLLSAETYKEGDFGLFAKKELNFSVLEGNIVPVINKCDLIRGITSKEIEDSGQGCYISAKTGQGVSELQELICNVVLGENGGGEAVFMARRRHLIAIDSTLMQLNLAISEFTNGCAFEIIAEHLRLAQNNLSEITGEVSSDDLLGEIFGSFCIGK
jgi:tRNA modification GTPase